MQFLFFASVSAFASCRINKAQADGQSDRQTDRQAGVQTDRDRDREGEGERARHIVCVLRYQFVMQIERAACLDRVSRHCSVCSIQYSLFSIQYSVFSIHMHSPERIQYHCEEHKFAEQRHHQRRGRNDFRQQQEEHGERQQNGYA